MGWQVRSALANRLAELGYDDRTIMRTIAMWRATQDASLVFFAYALCANNPDFRPPIEAWGMCS